MLAGNAREAVVRVADQLCAELGYGGGDPETLGARSALSGDGSGMAELLSPDDESLVAAMRRGLAKLAAAVGEEKPKGAGAEGAVCAALDGTELVMRGELVRGNVERLPSLMPSFVFLVTLPIVEQDEALELSRRAEELVGGLG